ncbi:MAG: endonuclease domain-containing protein [Actinomycetota bacterium]|nr:endonuclease domain-containing protein [Actinomycetota bacterium]
MYAVGHPVVSERGRWTAAVLAGGEGAVLSHRSAGASWGIVRWSGVTEITVPADRRSRAGLRVHASALPPDERTIGDGIPVTTVPRTLLDLAAVLPPARLERAVHEAEVLRLADPLSVADLLARHPGRRGSAGLRAILDDLAAAGARVTRSELEDRFLPLAAAAGLPAPLMNVCVEGFEVDCLWREHGLAVELDGRAAHATRAAFERDRARDRRLQAAGWRVIRITWRQLCHEPRAIADDLRRLLGSVEKP